MVASKDVGLLLRDVSSTLLDRRPLSSGRLVFAQGIRRGFDRIGGWEKEYVAFLLGINVGRRIVKMDALKKLFESLGFRDVQTYLASGNVRFLSTRKSPDTLIHTIEPALEKKFGFKVGVIVRPIADIEQIVAAHPFRGIDVTPDIRLYVTFLSEKPLSIAVPKSPAKEYKVLKVASGEVYSVLDLSKAAKTPDVMKLLGTLYGKKITTRNWNTIQKIGGTRGRR